VLGEPHRTELRFTNRLDREARGLLTLSAPTSWKVEPRRVRFELDAGETQRQPLTITLGQDVTAGPHPIKAEFEVRGEPPLAFCVHRRIQVGMGDVSLELATRLNGQGELEVRQRFVNRGDVAVDFRCHLFAPGRRPLRADVLALGPDPDVRTYRLTDGSKLLGETLWLRVEELRGRRVLNYRVRVQDSGVDGSRSEVLNPEPRTLAP